MTTPEIKKFMLRIKSHYNDFVINDYTISEYTGFLKDYDAEDLNLKLDEHVKNETYGDRPPKINYLVGGLTKTKDKGKIPNYNVMCPLCERFYSLEEFDKHYGRCLSTDYFIREYKRITGKELNRFEFENMSDVIFEEKYRLLQKLVINHPGYRGQDLVVRRSKGENISIDINDYLDFERR